MELREDCVEKINSSKIVFREHRSKLEFSNPENINCSKIKVDGCQITNGIRCDFLLRKNEEENYIELKGHNVNHAIKQLERSIKLLSLNKNSLKRSFVICTRSPLSSAIIQNFQLRFKKLYNSKLIVKSSPYTASV